MKAEEIVRPAAGIPAGIVPKLGLIAIADLHIGYESELAKEGVYLPRSQLDRLMGRLKRLAGTYRFKRLLINGDLKHSFSRLSKQERLEVGMFLDLALTLFDEIIVVRGNHDNYLSPLLKRRGLDLVTEYSEGNILFIHGHTDPGIERLEGRVVVIGHEHPSVVVRDALGYPYKFPVMLYVPGGRDFEIVVLPFSLTLTTGNVVTLDKSTLLSPILKNYGVIEEAVPYAIGEEFGVAELPKLSLLEKIRI